MATKPLLHLLALLSLILALVHSQMAMSQSPSLSSFEEEEEDEEEYVLDSPFSNTHLRSRFLASVIKKGASCDPDNYKKKKKKQVCNGVSANKGASILYCCKNHCRNVLGDMNNCGQCGNKCKLGQKCCGGRCIDVSRDPFNCGQCGKQCRQGKRCEYGYCGYA